MNKLIQNVGSSRLSPFARTINKDVGSSRLSLFARTINKDVGSSRLSPFARTVNKDVGSSLRQLADRTINNFVAGAMKPHRRFKGRLVVAGVGLFLVLLVADIWSLNRLATLGEQINKFEAASSELRLENQIMQNKIAKLTSLDEIEHRSLLLGFRSIKMIEILKTSDIALNP